MRLSLFTPAVCLLAAACERHPIPLDARQVLGPREAATSTQLSVRCSVEEDAADPLPIDGTDDAFSNVRHTLEDVASASLSKWAAATTRPGGWEVRLQLYRAHAKLSDRGHVELALRATLTSGVGTVYAAQTRAYCKEDADDATAAIDACMRSLAHDLEHWIEGVKP